MEKCVFLHLYTRGKVTLKSYLFILFFAHSLIQNKNRLHIITARFQER